MDTKHGLLFEKLFVILHRGFVQTRNLALGGNGQQIHDLADALEIVPELMADWKDEDLERIRDILTDYQAKYPGTPYDYLSILDMNEAEFLAVYRACDWNVTGGQTTAGL